MKKILNVVTTIFAVLVIIMAGVLVVPKFLGYKSYTVLSGSMEPKIHTGSLAFVKPSAPTEVEPNDIITFYLNPTTVATHRAMEVDAENQNFITKGDANDTADFEPIPFKNLIGIFVFSVPFMGYVAQFIQTKAGIVVICVLLIATVLSIMLPMILKKEQPKEETEEKL
ncbi:MAG: signal peptidase I [Oscillospiraceae bacterium]